VKNFNREETRQMTIEELKKFTDLLLFSIEVSKPAPRVAPKINLSKEIIGAGWANDQAKKYVFLRWNVASAASLTEEQKAELVKVMRNNAFQVAYEAEQARLEAAKQSKMEL
jgi:hypothetical protein